MAHIARRMLVSALPRTAAARAAWAPGTVRRRMSAASGAAARPWEQPLGEEDFSVMRDILAAPSPVGMEAAMTEGVLRPFYESFMPAAWALHRFRHSAALVVDTHPGAADMFTVMVVGHADKIRMQVRSVSEDGKVYINSDSFLPLTLLGNEVHIYSQDPARPADYRRIEGGTVEALGAIHFASADMRSGRAGVRAEQLYVELGLHGAQRGKQAERLGVKAGDAILLHRPIRRGLTPFTFQGAYLDNGLGCFVAAQVARQVARGAPLRNVRCLFASAAFEEIGRFGSRVLAARFQPDVIIATDVNHDYEAAPGVGDKRMTKLAMGKGFTLSYGAVASEAVNCIIAEAATRRGIPWQRDVCGRDTGTDAMAGVLASVDAAATSIGFPIRNMHTVSETGHSGDVMAAVHAIVGAVEDMERMNGGAGVRGEDIVSRHPRLDQARVFTREELQAALQAGAASSGAERSGAESNGGEEGGGEAQGSSAAEALA